MTNSKWIGTLNGSRFGGAFLSEDEHCNGRLVFTQAEGTTLVFSSRYQSGNANTISLLLEGKDDGAPTIVGELNLESYSSSHRTGTWRFVDGSAGTFDLIKKEFGASATGTNPFETSQLSVSNKEVPLGAITMYRPDLSRLISEIESYFEGPIVPIIRAKENSQHLTANAAEYLARGDLPEELKELTVSAEQNAKHGLKRIVSITISDDLDSRVTVSSPDELWTEAVSVRLSAFMNEFTGTFTGFMRRHGTNFNGLLLLGLIVAAPELELEIRLALLAAILVFILVVTRTLRLVPFARVYLDPDRIRKPFSKEFPGAIMALFTAMAAAASTAAPEFLQRIWVELANIVGP